MLTKEQIKDIIPHRDPFLLIDEMTEVEFGVSGTAVKHVSGDEYYFKGHFPGNPIMPGVLIVESMAQALAVILLGLDEYKGRIGLFAGIDSVKFKSVVRPGDELVMKVSLTKMKFGIAFAHGDAYVNGEVVCSADIKCAVQ